MIKVHTDRENYLAGETSDIPVSEVEVSDFIPEFSSIDESHMDSVNLDQPVIIAETASVLPYALLFTTFEYFLRSDVVIYP